jgi:hypothetical protein
LSRHGYSAAGETVNEFTSRLAASPRLFRHADRHRAVAGPVLQRRQAAPIGQLDQRVGLTRAFADTLEDLRDPQLTEHTFREMVQSRVYGILAGYEDQNDHDTLRANPVFKLVAGRSPDDECGLLVSGRDVALSPVYGAKAEANDKGINRRFVVTNRPGALILPGPTYDEYAGKGESENRNHEFKYDLAMDRLSDHRFVANYFRLYQHAAAMNLLVGMRRFIAGPLPARTPQAEMAAPAAKSWHSSHRAGRTWIGIVEYASACEPPSRFPFPILLAEPSESPLRCLPQAGVRGQCASGAGTGSGARPTAWMPLGGSLAARGSNNPG